MWGIYISLVLACTTSILSHFLMCDIIYIFVYIYTFVYNYSNPYLDAVFLLVLFKCFFEFIKYFEEYYTYFEDIIAGFERYTIILVAFIVEYHLEREKECKMSCFRQICNENNKRVAFYIFSGCRREWHLATSFLIGVHLHWNDSSWERYYRIFSLPSV